MQRPNVEHDTAVVCRGRVESAQPAVEDGVPRLPQQQHSLTHQMHAGGAVPLQPSGSSSPGMNTLVGPAAGVARLLRLPPVRSRSTPPCPASRTWGKPQRSKKQVGSVPASPASAACRAEVPAHTRAHQGDQGRDWRVEAHRLLERRLCATRSIRSCEHDLQAWRCRSSRNTPWCGLLWQTYGGSGGSWRHGRPVYGNFARSS